MTAPRVILVWLVLCAAGPACVTSGSSRCSKELTCPPSMMCSPAGDTCIDADLVLACGNKADAAPCTVAGLPPASCLGGICQASRCGDGRVTGGEQCDGVELRDQTCQGLGYYQPQGLRCGADCKFDTAQCAGFCGDGARNGGEQCDGKDLGHATCAAAGFHSTPGLACKADCTFDTAQCRGGRCGDGIINGLEQCDGKKFNRTCDQMGFAGAMSGLSCTPSCTFSTQSCLCVTGRRCKAGKQSCNCDKFGCGCVDIR